jgi:hypothetical protein
MSRDVNARIAVFNLIWTAVVVNPLIRFAAITSRDRIVALWTNIARYFVTLIRDAEFKRQM